MSTNLATTAKLLGDPGRAAILVSLMGGTARPAGELAAIGNVAPQTASGHLARLVEGGLLTVERQGRHRYYRLSSAQVGEAIEAMMVLGAQGPRAAIHPVRKSTPCTLEHARTCYAHLAGRAGVSIAESMVTRGLLTVRETKSYAMAYEINPAGREWFGALGIGIPATPGLPAKFARRCLDWTERRHHLAGTLGCAMYRRFKELRWMAPVQDSRVVRITVEGRRRLWDLLRIAIQ
jgi:DNA-binding transcriptional ArsR family regulator